MNETWKHYSEELKTPLPRAPLFDPTKRDNSPVLYVPDPTLVTAVNVAVELGLPLLVTGDPGCGKTQLAWHVALLFGEQEPLVFHAKTTSTAQDLFYHYNALGHFHSSRFDEHSKSIDALKFIHFQALGMAILRGLPPDEANEFLVRDEEKLSGPPVRSVVLIDEIDKAPRDFPNDILDEIESMAFTIQETSERVPKKGTKFDPRLRPIVILTSNLEKSLPDAFLRRCAFFHIPPHTNTQLTDIVRHRIKRSDTSRLTDADLDAAVALFQRIRNDLRRKPSASDLISWVDMLNRSDKLPSDVTAGDRDALLLTLAVLAKNKEDAERATAAIQR